MKSESLFHTLCYQTQMGNVYPEKANLSCMPQRSRWSSIKVTGDLSVATKKKQQNGLQNHFPRGGKSWHPDTQGWHLPPHATSCLRVC